MSTKSRPAPPSLTLLGTGTCQLEPDRMASSVLVELNGLRVLFDCGRGIANRLSEAGLRNDDIEHIVLSHFHPDHLSDLIPFLHAGARSRVDPRTKNLHIYGPRGVRVQVMRLLSLFGHEDLMRDDEYTVEIHEILDGPLVIAGTSFDFAHLPPAGNHGLRGRAGAVTFALTGDSGFHDAEVEFLRGVDVAVFDSGHLSREEILTLAVRAQTPMLVCSHLYTPLVEAELQAEASSRGYTGRIVVGHDLMVLPLARPFA